MILNEEGPCCNCGQRGCLEAFSSKQGISEYIMMQVKHGRDCCMKDVVKNGTFRSTLSRLWKRKTLLQLKRLTELVII